MISNFPLIDGPLLPRRLFEVSNISAVRRTFPVERNGQRHRVMAIGVRSTLPFSVIPETTRLKRHASPSLPWVLFRAPSTISSDWRMRPPNRSRARAMQILEEVPHPTTSRLLGWLVLPQPENLCGEERVLDPRNPAEYIGTDRLGYSLLRSIGSLITTRQLPRRGSGTRSGSRAK